MAETLPDQPEPTVVYGPDAKPLHPETSPADRAIATWQAESAYFVPSKDEKHRHIVDELLKERAVKLSQSTLWPLYRMVLNAVLNYRMAKRMVDTAGRLSAERAFAHASETIKMKLDVSGTEHIPKEGACILAANHPTGIADGLAIHDSAAPIRDDTIIFVNGDALRLNPLMTAKLIPVEWNDARKTRAKSRETLKASNDAFQQRRLVVLFPSGRLAFMDSKKVQYERVWMSSVAAMAKRYSCPIVPARIKSRNSWLYYWLSNVNEELRDMTLFHELLNKKGQTFHITYAPVIAHTELPEDNEEAAAILRSYVLDGIEKGQTFAEWRAAGGTATTVPIPPTG
ncbi:hypothetical protein PB2503_04197 [Parvularcula bermudensis HTCC2503]|uniref:Phospholipid/glycerol acyltransferase domain-containing protein n=1 Tax=Parvularcula bermudensis (strain ATCC BAA-594 / HTCC2503 / KCTC 12087) TaxID=314260 RepID=E0TEN1_PARBH|nr:lysophospholipid acyltransferase family protein [Parvularcula bermudensis]ADM08914.1 hypothetical protein PB2503_04197 [Parvularcula bermudensis HTCC2503]